MSLNTDTPEGDVAPTENTASNGNWTPKLIRWAVALLALQTAAIIGFGAVLIAASASQTDRVVAANEETLAAVEDLPSHDPQAELESGDLLCEARDGDVSYRPGLGGVFVHECRYRDPVTGRSQCSAHDIYGNSWSCSDR